ncbi:MAG: circularly permuted type 2 ATP-grasp protein [Candidatus Nanopelagicales bacterium]
MPTYVPAETAYDEMYDDASQPRAGLDVLHNVLAELGSDGLRDRGRLRDAHLSAQGITFTLSGRERPLPLDLIPRVVTADEWRTVSEGVAQRIRALEAFLADVYDRGDIMTDGVVPKELVTSSSHFHRQAHGIVPANGVRIHVAGVDLVRDEAGIFRVLEDNLRCPSGVSYVLENRRTLAHVLPEVFAGYRVQPVSEYPERLYRALAAAAPRDVAEPTVVVLTPGVYNSAHFEHAFLARRMGAELVEGRDLFCRGGFVYMRTTQGPQPVHVIYRRLDDEYLDPVQFLPDSVLGVPGLLNAARAGTVTIANGVGNGVADDKALYPYVPKIIEYYLGEQPILPNVSTYDLRDRDVRSFVLGRIDRMVIKPVDGSGGYGLVIGPQASDADLAAAATAIQADPRRWIAQPVVSLSTSPTVASGGRLQPRHLDLRPFAINDGKKIWVLPGGLTRVALTQGSLVVNSSQGGGSKDTWVLGGGENNEEDEWIGAEAILAARAKARAVPVAGPANPRDSLPRTHEARMRQQEEQQQQQQPDRPAGEDPC